MRTLYVYILSSTTHVLYVGMTNSPYFRVAQHRAGLVSFTRRYRVHRLAYVEEASGPRAAIGREKQLKRWTRARKIALIEGMNPRWLDLARGWPSLDVILHSRGRESRDAVRGQSFHSQSQTVGTLAQQPGAAARKAVEIPRFAQDDGGGSG